MKKIIRLTESDLTKIVRRVLNEQIIGNLVKPPRINVTKSTPWGGKTPRTIDDDGGMPCEYTSEEKMRNFFINAKTFFKGGVDEKYMNLVIEKMKKELGSFWSGSPIEFLRLLGSIKTEAGIGYLLRTFKLNNKNLFTVLSEDHRFPWLSVVQAIKKNFSVSNGPPGCNGVY